MRLYVDLETLQLIEGPGFRNPVNSLRFKRGDAAQLEVTFLANGTTPATIGDPATLELQFGIKPRGRYDVGYLVHESDWTLPAPEAESPSYLCSPSFNTNELDSAMQGGSATGSERSESTLMGEITWREGAGEPTSTRTFLVVVDNDVNRGTEGVPTDAEPAYPLPAAIELVARKGVADGYPSLDSGGARIPVAQLPATAELTTRKGVANGYAGLGSNGKVPSSQLPTIPAAVLHSELNGYMDPGYAHDVDLDEAGAIGLQDLMLLRFPPWIASPRYFARISFPLLDAYHLAILDAEFQCGFEGYDGSPNSSWLWNVWIDGAFDPYRPTSIWLEGKECPFGYDPYGGYGGYGGYNAWTGSGVGTQDEFGQINLAAISGTASTTRAPMPAARGNVSWGGRASLTRGAIGAPTIGGPLAGLSTTRVSPTGSSPRGLVKLASVNCPSSCDSTAPGMATETIPSPEIDMDIASAGIWISGWMT